MCSIDDSSDAALRTKRAISGREDLTLEDVDDRRWAPHPGLLRGPSEGLRAWADWLLDVRQRWHEGAPQRKVRASLMIATSSALVVGTIAERILTG